MGVPSELAALPVPPLKIHDEPTKVSQLIEGLISGGAATGGDAGCVVLQLVCECVRVRNGTIGRTVPESLGWRGNGLGGLLYVEGGGVFWLGGWGGGGVGGGLGGGGRPTAGGRLNLLGPHITIQCIHIGFPPEYDESPPLCTSQCCRSCWFWHFPCTLRRTINPRTPNRPKKGA